MTQTIAEKIKRLRKSNGFSQEEIAEKLNISQSAYARMENGDSDSWSTRLEKICKIF
jgi:transcriptional regulator with XRE-family HTH domain